VAEGKTRGGDFARTPLCTRRAQVACVVAFSTFAEDPPADARFGISRTPPADNPSTLPGGPGFQVACTDPRPLAGVKGPFGLLVPSEPFAPGPIFAGIVITSNGAPPSAPTTWVSPADRGEGTCRTINGAHVLRIEPLPGSRRPMWFPEPTWGTHLVDANFALDTLVSLVAQQARRWTDPHMRLRATCAKHGLRVRVSGRDAGFVRRADFRLGRRLVARDRTRAFRARIGREALLRSKAKRVKAIAQLRLGAPARRVLSLPIPACARPE
jgi:hypothetical protein